ncbi:hypothetical protein MYAM1_002600 [Malassezia yamatoensis]|uniref:Something about silencing protein 4 domain-containing protein n=1 Tax=Malassezia yamatoensis TaxID=253288 RepID=A0AAJ6CHG2_9BASI|nr:hypothetical protein MYAM1_002600 [Malassezia yamatoensis]
MSCSDKGGAQRPLHNNGDASLPKRARSLRRSQLESKLLLGDQLKLDMLLNPPPRNTQDDIFLPGETVFVLDETRVEEISAQSSKEFGKSSDRVQKIFAYLSDPEKARECAAMQQVEIPDFCIIDTSSLLGKTRGTNVSVCEWLTQADLSDDTYSARHHRHERAEKKLRKEEKDRLCRDRRQLCERISALEQVDVQLLVPMLAALEAEQGKPARSSDELLRHVTDIHTAVIADARATLSRYDKLLPDEAMADSTGNSENRLKQHSSPIRAHKNGSKSNYTQCRPSQALKAERPRAAQRLGLTLAQIATAHGKKPPHDSFYPTCNQRNTPELPQKDVATAFGEQVPEVVTIHQPFEIAMAKYLAQSP